MRRADWNSNRSLSIFHQYENDKDLGISVIDTYTHYVLEYLEQINKTSQLTMQDLVRLEPFLSLTQTADTDCLISTV